MDRRDENYNYDISYEIDNSNRETIKFLEKKIERLKAENKELREAQEWISDFNLLYKYKGEIYPYIQRCSEEDELITTICPDVNGDFFLVELHSSNGMKLVDFLAKDDIHILVKPPKEQE